MTATKEGIAKFNNDSMMRMFGTTDILEILGPAGTIPPTQSIAMRMKTAWGMRSTSISRWAKSHIPEELYDQLKPYQKPLEVSLRKSNSLEKYGGNSSMCDPSIRAKRDVTNLSRYGSTNLMLNPELKAKMQSTNINKYGGVSPFCSPDVKAKRDATFIEKYGCNPLSLASIQAKIKSSNTLRYGGHPLSLPPQEILKRLKAYDLKPLEPIESNSDSQQQIRVKCKLCGREFITRWTSRSNRGYSGAGLISCGCIGHHSLLEKYLMREFSLLGYTVYSTKPEWFLSPKGARMEIDLYFPDLNIGIEINGYACHSADDNCFGSDPKPIDYHAIKSRLCLQHGIKLYHYWYNKFSDVDPVEAFEFCKHVVEHTHIDVSPGDKLDRDIYPDPTEAGLPYTELPPEPFETPNGICYNSGYWQF